MKTAPRLPKRAPHPSAELIFMTSLPIADPLHQDALTLAPVLSKTVFTTHP